LSDQPKNLLDVLASVQSLERRLSELENSLRIVDAGDFEIDEDSVLVNGNGERSVPFSITFNNPLSDSPKVYTAITALNTDCNEKVRIEVRSEEVSERGCTIQVHTWGNSEIYHVKISWIAVL